MPGISRGACKRACERACERACARNRFIKLLHRGTGHVAAPAGPLEMRLTEDLRASPAIVEWNLEFADSWPDSRFVWASWLRNWRQLWRQIPELSDAELSEFRAALGYEKIIAPFLPPAVQAARESLEREGAVIPPLTFLCAVEEDVDREIARREACGVKIHRAAPWPMPESSAAERCKCAKISANAPGTARLMFVLYSQKAEYFCPRSEEDLIALAWYHNSQRLNELSDAEFAAVRAAMEDFEGMFYPYLRHPDSFAAQMRNAISAELPRRQFKVMLTIMLARERCAALAAGSAEGLAEGLAALSSRPIEMIAEAVRNLPWAPTLAMSRAT